MNKPVRKLEKRNFLYWFLKQYETKEMEAQWILVYLLHHEDLLDHIHFVHDISLCPRAITISTKEVEQDSFRFYNNHIVTANIEKAFHDIRLNPFESLYIQLFFPEWRRNHHYAGVIEENPFVSDETYITREDKMESEKFIQYSMQLQRKKEIKIQIDQALDNKNEKKFRELTEELDRMESMLNISPNYL